MKKSIKLPIGTVVPFALPHNYIPRGWLLCDGTEIPPGYKKLIGALKSENTPNLSGLTLVGTGRSKSRSFYRLAQIGGEERHRLSEREMPRHGHGYQDTNPIASRGNFYSGGYWQPGEQRRTTEQTGGNQPHNNMQPFYAVNFIIYAGKKMRLKRLPEG